MRLRPLSHAERVDRGWNRISAATYSGWQWNIRHPVNLKSSSLCPLGQVFRSYSRGLDRLGIWAPGFSYGFHGRLIPWRFTADCRALEAEWTRRIAEWKEDQRLKYVVSTWQAEQAQTTWHQRVAARTGR